MSYPYYPYCRCTTYKQHQAHLRNRRAAQDRTSSMLFFFVGVVVIIAVLRWLGLAS